MSEGRTPRPATPGSGLDVNFLNITSQQMPVEAKRSPKSAGRRSPLVLSPKSEMKIPRGKGAGVVGEAKESEEERVAREEREFDQVKLEGEDFIRRGTLDSVQSEVECYHQSRKSLDKSFKEAKLASENVECVIDNNLRKLTITQAVVTQLQNRLEHSSKNNFQEGSESSKYCNSLRRTTSNIVKQVRKAKLVNQVEATKTNLKNAGFTLDGIKEHK
eukprot:CAMPEP_0203770450 /NCGR_PEP_ID=MMETSP0099_2-20121227/2826_1 /ASSEMBLY_ACC=CAM_ASM_000209 /TAXON_ID=96639 /ORGANISM=" , Strain NY0313808BC1" /LENGTH=216 /DNA_ID=CAMNT_0050667605 /DNA_START=13 /DNA_END=663 /DNA_ORIENTATION=-